MNHRSLSIASFFAVLLILFSHSPAAAINGWEHSQARAYAVSTVTDQQVTTHHIYLGVMIGSVPTTIVATCPGPDYYNCLVARLGSCSKTTTSRTFHLFTETGGSTWEETITSCTSPGAGSCKTASGPFGKANAFGSVFGSVSLEMDSLSSAAGCTF